MVKFCPVCTNIYTFFLKTEESPKLYYKCESCGKDDEPVSDNDIQKGGVLFTKTNTNKLPDRNINVYMTEDRTLTHSSNPPCPNPKCVTNDKKNAKFEKYDNVCFHYNSDMKIAYMCVECKVNF